jgi:hypothetical protein
VTSLSPSEEIWQRKADHARLQAERVAREKSAADLGRAEPAHSQQPPDPDRDIRLLPAGYRHALITVAVIKRLLRDDVHMKPHDRLAWLERLDGMVDGFLTQPMWRQSSRWTMSECRSSMPRNRWTRT